MKKILIIMALGVFGLAFASSAAVVTISNGNFEDDLGSTVGSGIANFTQSVTGWFERNGATRGDALQWDGTGSATIPDDADGQVWGLLNISQNAQVPANSPGAFYQSIGVFTENLPIELFITLGNRSNLLFPDLDVSLYSGNVTGADGSSLTGLGATLLDTYTITSSVFPLGDAADDSIPAQVVDLSNIFLNTGSSGVAGETLWLEITAVNPGGFDPSHQALVDDIFVVFSAPEPSSLALLGVGLLLIRLLRSPRRNGVLSDGWVGAC